MTLNQYIQRENLLQPPIPQFSHDANLIIFRRWTSLLSLGKDLAEENHADSHVLFLDENADTPESERIRARRPVGLRNATQFAHLNITILCARSGKKVFFVPELPAGRSLHLEFLQEGLYTLHYFPAFSQKTLCRSLQIVASIRPTSTIAPNFRPCLTSRY